MRTPDELKSKRGRPAKDAVRVNLNLARDVAEFLDSLNEPGKIGAATKFVEDAVREKIKRDHKSK